MRRILACGLAVTFLATGCSDQSERTVTERVTTVDASEPTADYAMPPPPPPPAPGQVANASAESVPSSMGEIPVGIPQIAYRFTLGFRLPADSIKTLQETHADLCEARGPLTCRIISMQQSEQDGDYGQGTLQLAVASNVARDFSKQLEETGGEADGELVSSSIEGEDLSKQIVDTEARLRARIVLRDRLMDVLENRRGTVTELVEAERGVAQVNQEIDQAQSWLTEMRGRVAYSTMTVNYEAGEPSSGGFSDPIRDAWGSIGSILGTIIGFLMLTFTVLIPFLLIGGMGVLIYRWSQRNKPRAERDGEGGVVDPAE